MEAPTENQLNRDVQMFGYKRANGEAGVGFEIEHAGLKQHSVVWEHSVAERFREEDLAQYKIEFGVVRSFVAPGGHAIGMGFYVPDSDKPGSHRWVQLVTIPRQAFSEPGETIPKTIPETVPTDAGGESTDSEQTPKNAAKITPETVPGDDQSIVHGSNDEPTSPLFIPGATPQNNIMAFLMANTEATDADIIRAMHESGLEVSTDEVKAARQQNTYLNG